MPLEVKYELEGGGWAECVITNGKQCAKITASYLSDALGDLATAVLEILTVEHCSKAYFEEDPGKVRWIFEWTGDNIKILIGEWENNKDYRPLKEYNDYDYYAMFFGCACSPRELLEAMVTCLNDVFNKHGITEYQEGWMKDDFPLETLKKLSDISESNKEIKKCSDAVMNRYRKWKKSGDDLFEFAYKSLLQNTDKEEALDVITQALKMGMVASGWRFCDNWLYPDAPSWRKAWAYQIAAMVFIWNGLFDKAYELEKYFLYREFREKFDNLTNDYLILLITFNHAMHLEELFSDPLFKKTFIFAWEAYILVLVNDKIDYFADTTTLVNNVKRAETIYFG